MKRFITFCLILFLAIALFLATYAEGIKGGSDGAMQNLEIISDSVEPEAVEPGEFMLTGDDASTEGNLFEVSALEDRAVSAPVPKSANCVHSKYSKLKGGYKKYSKLNSKNHTVTAYIPDDPSISGVNCYFVKCDACGEVGFFWDDDWDTRVTWESEGEIFYYDYSVICTEKRFNEAHTFVSGKCSKCGYKGSASTTVKLNINSVTLGVKEDYKLTARVNPASKAKSLRYKSSDTKVATVGAKTGIIVAKKVGTAKIKAVIGSKTLATCKVTVKKATKKITLNKSKVTLAAGKTYQLKPTLTKGTYTFKINWTSSNKKVAKVSSKGKITAVKKGTATITATTANGKKATCKVTVNNQTIKNELSGYFGKDIHDSAKAIGGMKYFESDGEDNIKDIYENDKIGLCGWDNVSIVRLTAKSDYMLKGLKVGMSRETIRAKMKGYSLMGDGDDRWSAQYIIKGSKTDWEILLGVEYDDNGFAEEIEYGIWS